MQICYAVKCPKCNHAFETVCYPKDRAALKCVKCKHKRVEPNFQQCRLALERIFSGIECESLAEAVHPSEVKEARQLFPNNTIRDDGTFIWNKRGDLKEFKRRRDALQKKTEDDKARNREQRKSAV